MKFNTKTIHGRQEHEKAYGAVMSPIYQTSTYAQSTPGGHKGYEYSRTHNPTRNALENAFASIENGEYGLAFGSGLAAIDAVIKLLKPGDEVISTNDLYGGTYRLFTKIFEGAKARNILLAVDNTFATPYLQQPLELGADIVMHSATKYIGGHSDLVMGALIVKDKELADRLYFIQNASGAICGPQDSFLALRGIKTLHIRMQRHCENGKAIAQFLKTHPKVDKVYWPGFTDHPNHNVAKEQMNDYGGMISFTTKEDSYRGAVKVVEKLKIFTLAESLGGVESLAGHPASMTHASLPKEEREKIGIKDSLIRLSVGIEDIEDLILDLSQALSDSSEKRLKTEKKISNIA